ncbi:hypothetical protein HOLleu_41312 [Holothuria leucospilota]|uniref:Uncharacterized protein n=1 Tax=Holothuria leucospilota TaxID=206669 RepID=A0A9Q0YGC1_HOLLE|nr:hypothetical protein HOLleu_41312 [Holothuria leucospilota]
MLYSKLWKKRGIKTMTKVAVYRAVVLMSLLNSCETWTPYARHIKKLNNFQMVCSRKILKIHCQDKVPDCEALEYAELPSISALVRKAQLRWVVHVVRMPKSHLPKKFFYSEFKAGKQHPGGHLKHLKDNHEASLNACSISVHT